MRGKGTVRVLGICVAALALWPGPTEVPTAVVPFDLHGARRTILVQVMVNRDPAVFVLDTGATHTVVSDKVLGKRSVPDPLPEARFDRKQPGFSGQAEWGMLDLALGDLSWKARRVVIMNLDNVDQAYQQEVGGLLGQDVFLEFRRMTIDFEHKKLLLFR